MRFKSALSHGYRPRYRYTRKVSPGPHTVRTMRRHFTMRAATLLLTAIVTVVGLWGISHADDAGVTAPTVASSTASAPSVDAALGHLVENAGDVAGSDSMVIGIVSCLIGILCGLALATLIVFMLRCRQLRFQRLRPRIAQIHALKTFDHRGKHQFGLYDLSLLRI